MDDRTILISVINAMEEFRTVEKAMPLQYAEAFLFISLQKDTYAKDLANFMELPQTSVSRVIAALGEFDREGRPGFDLARSFVDPLDSRRRIIRLTSKGEALKSRVLHKLKAFKDEETQHSG